MMDRRAFFATLTGGLLAGCAEVEDRAPIIQAPTYQVGDTWSLSNGAVSRVIRIEDDGAVIFTWSLGFVGGAPRYRWRDGTVEELGTREGDLHRRLIALGGSGWQFLNFPLEVGKSWHFSNVGYIFGRAHHFTVSCTVWSYDDVHTQAGQFAAYRMTIEWAGQTPEYRFSNLHNFWYAPAVKFMVRERSTDFSWELLSYELR
jgi:hypothetical protein